MSDYAHVLSVAMREPWAIEPTMLSVIANILGTRILGERMDTSALAPRPKAAPARQQMVAVLPVQGVIAPKMNAFSEISGGATFQEIGQQVKAAADDPQVSHIVLDIDSPGGNVVGARECARAILEARTKKPVIAHANHQMASAAYWLGACATEIVASPSASVGSVGVYTIHEDRSAMLAQKGVRITYVAAGKFKTAGNPHEPLSEVDREHLKAQVDRVYGHFIDAIAQGRGVSAEAVRSGFGEGRLVHAEDALAAGMIDRIATLDETLARVTGAPAPLAVSAVVPERDTPQEPSPATGQDRVRQHRTARAALLALGL